MSLHGFFRIKTLLVGLLSTATSAGLWPELKNFFLHLILHTACLYMLPWTALSSPKITSASSNACLLFLTQHRLNMVGSCHQSKFTQQQQQQQQQQSWYQPVSTLPPSLAGLCISLRRQREKMQNSLLVLPFYFLLQLFFKALMPCMHPMGLSLQGLSKQGLEVVSLARVCW